MGGIGLLQTTAPLGLDGDYDNYGIHLYHWWLRQRGSSEARNLPEVSSKDPPGMWENFADLPEAMCRLHVAAFVRDIYLSDGRRCHAFNVGRKDLRSFLCPGTGKVTLFAHADSKRLFAIDFHTTLTAPLAWRKNHLRDTWLPVAIEMTNEGSQTAALQLYNSPLLKIVPTLDDNQFYTVGWLGDERVYRFSITSQNQLKCERLPDMIEFRSSPEAIVGDGGVLYVVGGIDPNLGGGMEKYDPRLGRWERCENMPIRRVCFHLLLLSLPGSVVDSLNFDQQA